MMKMMKVIDNDDDDDNDDDENESQHFKKSQRSDALQMPMEDKDGRWN